MLPLLRSPPFPGVAADAAAVSLAGGGDHSAIDPASLMAAIRDARVGGAFWAAPVALNGATEVVRVRDAAEARHRRGDGMLVLRRARMIDPWSLLRTGLTLHLHGDDELVALAKIAGVRIRLLSHGHYADTAPAALLLDGVRYRDPFTGRAASPAEAVTRLAEWRRLIEANRPIVAAAGFAWWKRREVARLLWADRPLLFTRSTARAIRVAARAGGTVAAWPSRVSPALGEQAAARAVPVVRVEDGFIRSVGLGSDLFPPLSIVADTRGIHYDPATPSDLEVLLQRAVFRPDVVARAEALRTSILAAGIGKYGGGTAAPAPARLRPERPLLLVPGQVEDDQSVLRGGGGVASNLDLLRRARAAEPDAEIWFRPHPDVDAGHRRGRVSDVAVLAIVDRVVRGGSMAGLLDAVDAVHTLTSLTGFEALLRGIAVTTHGVPFYAGWGLTRDLGAVPTRRMRRLSLAELVAGVLILYPRYLDPVTRLPCPPETLIARIVAGQGGTASLLTRLRRVQGGLMRRFA